MLNAKLEKSFSKKRGLVVQSITQEKILFKDQLMCMKDVGTEEVQCLVSKFMKKISINSNLKLSKWS